MSEYNKRDIYEIKLENYLKYSKEVISNRAFPDVRDGLKPVQRRILYAAYHMSDKFVKSARIVGDTLGKYHPHGDQAIYGALVNMAQPWSLKNPLLKGQGNFGNIGDNAAQMRYTEAKLSALGKNFFNNFNKKTAIMQYTYDGNDKEPVVLCPTIPNLLINGTQGIGVAIATKIATHNLTEVCNCLIAYIKNKDISLDELIEIIPGPDFPNNNHISTSFLEIKKIFSTGNGYVTLTGDCSIEQDKIIINSIPYSTSKSALISKLIELQTNKLYDIKSISDESGKNLRIVVYLNSGANGRISLNNIYNSTSLRIKYHSTWFAINGKKQPKIYNLKTYFDDYLSFRHQIIISNASYNLSNMKYELSKCLCLLIVRENSQQIIDIVKSKSNNDDVIRSLMSLSCKIPDGFDQSYLNIKGDYCYLSREQADIILATKISQLANQEREKLIKNINQIKENIGLCLDLLANDGSRDQKIIDDLSYAIEKFGSKRSSEITYQEINNTSLDFVEKEDVVVVIDGDVNKYIKRISLSEYKTQNAGGKGSNSIAGKTIKSNTHDRLLCFFDNNLCQYLDTYLLPNRNKKNKGKACVNFFSNMENANLINLLSYKYDIQSKEFILFIFKNGNVRKNPVSNYSKINKSGKQYAIDANEVVAIVCANNDDDMLMTSKFGKVLRIKVSNFNQINTRKSNGVKGISLQRDDEIISAIISNDDNGYLCLISNKGVSKKTVVNKFNHFNRGSQGVIGFKLTRKTGFNVAGAAYLSKEVNNDILIFHENGHIRINSSQIPESNRNTSGNILIKGIDNITNIIPILS